MTSEFTKFGDVIIHDCRDSAEWDSKGIVIWYSRNGDWYMYTNTVTSKGDVIIKYCPLCGVKLHHYFVKKGVDLD